MKLSGINLNLLVSLDILLEEQNVTKAAKRLNLSQPQMSYILKELRNLFDDELLVRGPERQMMLTEKANSLILPVNELINRAHDIFKSQRPFEPHKAKMTFTLGTNSNLSIVICPGIFKRIYRSAPGITFIDKIISDLEDHQDFQRKQIDIAVGTYVIDSVHLCRETILDAQLSAIVYKHHPVFKRRAITTEDLKKNPLIIVAFNDYYKKKILNQLDNILGKGSYKYFIVPHVVSAATILKIGGAIALAYSGKEMTIKAFDKFSIGFMHLPFTMEPVRYSMYWKKSDDSSSSHSWFRNQVRSVFRGKLSD